MGVLKNIESFVLDIIRFRQVDKVSIDGTMIIIHMGPISTNAEMDVRKSATGSNRKFGKK